MSAYSDYKSGAIEEWQYRAICRREEERESRESNPCKGCPNLEIDDVYGNAFCILGGGENCDLEERNGKSDV